MEKIELVERKIDQNLSKNFTLRQINSFSLLPDEFVFDKLMTLLNDTLAQLKSLAH